jgi:hypothetical protein
VIKQIKCYGKAWLIDGGYALNWSAKTLQKREAAKKFVFTDGIGGEVTPITGSILCGRGRLDV